MLQYSGASHFVTPICRSFYRYFGAAHLFPGRWVKFGMTHVSSRVFHVGLYHLRNKVKHPRRLPQALRSFFFGAHLIRPLFILKSVSGSGFWHNDIPGSGVVLWFIASTTPPQSAPPGPKPPWSPASAGFPPCAWAWLSLEKRRPSCVVRRLDPARPANRAGQRLAQARCPAKPVSQRRRTRPTSHHHLPKVYPEQQLDIVNWTHPFSTKLPRIIDRQFTNCYIPLLGKSFI